MYSNILRVYKVIISLQYSCMIFTCTCGSLSVMRHGKFVLVFPNVTNVAVRSLCVSRIYDLQSATEKLCVELYYLSSTKKLR